MSDPVFPAENEKAISCYSGFPHNWSPTPPEIPSAGWSFPWQRRSHVFNVVHAWAVFDSIAVFDSVAQIEDSLQTLSRNCWSNWKHKAASVRKQGSMFCLLLKDFNPGTEQPFERINHPVKQEGTAPAGFHTRLVLVCEAPSNTHVTAGTRNNLAVCL